MSHCHAPMEPQRLMAALWGSFSQEETENHTGPEKRLELDLRERQLDLRERQNGASLSKDALLRIANDLGAVQSVRLGDHGCSVLCDVGTIIATKLRVVVTSGSAVQMHKLVQGIVDTVVEAGFDVEWASFMRKNNVSPWDSRDKSMAHEYKSLKDVFPTGQPFIFGSVDSDHYFYYVYDDLKRGPGCVESDVQVNVKMYNFDRQHDAPASLFKMDGAHDARDKSGLFQAVTFSEDGTYRTLRLAESDNASTVASFETSEEMVDCAETVATAVECLKPERFTLIVLVDPHSSTAKHLSKRAEIGIEADKYAGYTMMNRTVNEFAHGYIVVKVSFARSS